ncbi:phosphoinositide phosphatase SAC3-like isoform X1 [Typha angustifolia]|uniref:phosphoinositide phosphatase SAC3-like isoform X1 n=1 Tax=Typha angustifolia TaxID=59011 RepID=UPI003C3053F0
MSSTEPLLARDLVEMAVENGAAYRIPGEPGFSSCCLENFELYETQSKFYMLGSDKSGQLWRVLTIDRLEPSELNIHEDSTTYSQIQKLNLMNQIDGGNKSTGGLKFVTKCYGIIGLVKFLGPYYMLVITEREEIGAICGHTVYKVTKSKVIVLPNPSIHSNLVDSNNENRYLKLLCTVDLTKDFYFSYSYHLMRSLQENLCDAQEGQALYDTMFVWNEFLTRGIRHHLKSTVWIVALVYGFFKQDKLSVSGKVFWLTLIARRSRHFAGTRYLKRGVNEHGSVANDVEIEQIAFEEVPGEPPSRISSAVQNRGSIPLFWSQETSKMNLKPDIIVHNDEVYKATRLHFKNLASRYGNPIIILNLIKRCERKPRESLLRREFDKAIKFINRDLSEENHLRFLHWDLRKNSRSSAEYVLTVLVKVASEALNLIDIFYCQGALTLRPDGCQEDISISPNTSVHGIAEDRVGNSKTWFAKPTKLQQGVLRTNCIDCLDRTNVAQYAYGLAALGHQLHALGLIDVPEVGLDTPLAVSLMDIYEIMGDTLAQQYSGSNAHNKIFSERRGHLKLAIRLQEFFRTLQRHHSNAYMDANKQASIDLFLGYLQPQQCELALEELDSDQHCNIEKSLLDDNISLERDTSVSSSNAGQNGLVNSAVSEREKQAAFPHVSSDTIAGYSTYKNEVSYSRCTTTVLQKKLSTDDEHICSNENRDFSNFLDVDRLSSLCEEELYERSTSTSSSIENLSTENVCNGITSETTPTQKPNGVGVKEIKRAKCEMPCGVGDFTESFQNWVNYGDIFGDHP